MIKTTRTENGVELSDDQGVFFRGYHLNMDDVKGSEGQLLRDSSEMTVDRAESLEETLSRYNIFGAHVWGYRFKQMAERN